MYPYVKLPVYLKSRLLFIANYATKNRWLMVNDGSIPSSIIACRYHYNHSRILAVICPVLNLQSHIFQLYHVKINEAMFGYLSNRCESSHLKRTEQFYRSRNHIVTTALCNHKIILR